jgi:penicillin-binding protein 2
VLYREDQQTRNERTSVMLLSLCVAFLVLLLRIGWLQFVKGDEMQRTAELNRLRLDPIHAPRGILLDRKGRPLVRNRPAWNIILDPPALRHHEEEVFQELMSFQDSSGTPFFDSTFLRRQLLLARLRPFERPVLLEDASTEEIAFFAEHQYRLPGVMMEVTTRREYPLGALAGHLLGYIGAIPEDQIEELEPEGYHLGDLIGQMGLEKQYETLLRGKDGIRYLEVDAHGRVVGSPKDMPSTDPVPGRNILTTLDLDLQMAAEEALPDSLSGAVVAIDPRNGEILAMASSPRLDPNIFSLPARKRAKEWAKLALDPRRPLNNRAIQGLYEPGSTFKIVASMAGLRSGRVSYTSTMPAPCTGGFRFGSRYQHCWSAAGHGYLNMNSAMAASCDVYYYQLGLMINMPIINETAQLLGLGSPSGVDLPGEKRGLLIDSASYERRNRRLHWRWARGLILNLSIGQGQLVTPLQVAQMAAGIGNGEVLWRPHLLKQLIDPRTGRVVGGPENTMTRRLPFEAEYVQDLRASLDSVVNGGQGTGHQAGLPGIRVGGKTGSAENPHGRTHALFAGFAPTDAPEIAVGVVVENAGHGGSVAAPIAGKIFRRYFELTGRLKRDTAHKEVPHHE